MVRAWNAQKGVLVPGILIDTLAYRFMQRYKHADKSYTYYDWMSRDFFQHLMDVADQDYWLIPGSGRKVYDEYGFDREAKEAHAKCLEALMHGDNDYLWHSDWRSIYGSKFPTV